MNALHPDVKISDPHGAKLGSMKKSPDNRTALELSLTNSLLPDVGNALSGALNGAKFFFRAEKS